MRIVSTLLGAVMAGQALAADPADPVPGFGALSHAELLRRALPDLVERDGVWEATLPDDLRPIADSDAGDGGRPVSVAWIDAVALAGGGVALLAPLSGDTIADQAILATFAADGTPIDAVNVAEDRMTFFGDPPALVVGRDISVIHVVGAHLNAGQDYGIDLLVLADGQAMALIDMFPRLSDLGCGFARRQDFSVTAVPGAAGLADLEVAVTETVTAVDETCADSVPPPPGARRVTVIYRYDPAAHAYRASSDALDRLAEETAQRY